MSRVDMRFVAQELEFEATLQKDLKEDQEWRELGQFENETQNWPVQEVDEWDYINRRNDDFIYSMEDDWRNEDLFDNLHDDY